MKFVMIMEIFVMIMEISKSDPDEFGDESPIYESLW